MSHPPERLDRPVITAHALRRWAERYGRPLNEGGALELLKLVRRAHLVGANPRGGYRYRGPKPLRIQLSVRIDGERQIVESVWPPYEGWRPPRRT